LLKKVLVCVVGNDSMTRLVVVLGRTIMALGTVKWFNDSSIQGDGFRSLAEGQTVEYDEADGPKGLFAARVLPPEGSPQASAPT
jgi:cold shock protein